MAARLCNEPRIHIFDGDVCKKDLGLNHATTQNLQQTIRVVIHAAYSMTLRHSLAQLVPVIIQGTLHAADFALGCASLDKFVYISTAYANSHLH